MGDSKVAVALIRVSTNKQEIGPTAQRTAIEAWAAREGVSVVAWHEETVCSTTALDRRPGLVAALESLRVHGAGAMVVAKRDRISRDPVLSATIEGMVAKVGATLVSAAGEGNGSTPADEFMRGVIDCAAKYEHALIKARTRAAMQALRDAGKPCGGAAPYGLRYIDGPMRTHKDGSMSPVRVLVEDEGEQAVLARARALRASGASLRAIVEALGPVSRKGTPFAVSALHAMLTGEARAAA